MKVTNKIDINSLQEEAKKSEEKEAFTVLARTNGYRVGVGARLKTPANPIFFVEIIASLCPRHHDVNLNSLEKNLRTLKQLKERGYLLTCDEDGTISCEFPVPSENLVAEYKAANSILEKCLE
jgi:hypothetical protein